MNVTKSARLLNDTPPSDKEYRVQIETVDNATFAVVGYWGPRGSNLTRTVKDSDVSAEAADKSFEKIIKGQLKKGYRLEDSSAAPHDVARLTSEMKDSGLRPQLLNAIERREAVELCCDDAWGAQIKEDGERTMIRKAGNVVVASNRSGQVTSIVGNIESAFLESDRDFVIDGELVKGVFYAFDLLEIDGISLAQESFIDRFDELRNFVEGESLDSAVIVRVALYSNTVDKLRVLEEAELSGLEGLVFKRLSSAYVPGRPTESGDQLKFKFWRELSAIVSGTNGKSSVSLELIDGNRRVFVGNVTVKANQTKPPVGAIVDVKYLWMVNVGGSLYQPELKKVRNDIPVTDCTVAQIFYKGKAQKKAA